MSKEKIKNLFKNKKFLVVLGISIIAIALTIGGILYFNSNKNDNSKNDISEIDKQANDTYLVIEINPKFMLQLDNNGKILEVIQLNDDAKIFTNEDLKDLDLDKAIDRIIEIAQNKGYLKDKKDISISILDNGNDKYLNQAIKRIEDKGINAVKTTINKEDKQFAENFKNIYNSGNVYDKPLTKSEKDYMEKIRLFTLHYNMLWYYPDSPPSAFDKYDKKNLPLPSKLNPKNYGLISNYDEKKKEWEANGSWGSFYYTIYYLDGSIYSGSWYYLKGDLYTKGKEVGYYDYEKGEWVAPTDPDPKHLYGSKEEYEETIKNHADPDVPADKSQEPTVPEPTPEPEPPAKVCHTEYTYKTVKDEYGFLVQVIDKEIEVCN